MPIKGTKKGGGVKYRTFGQMVGDYKKKGYSEESARKIVGSMQRDQEGKKKKRKHY